MRVAAFVACSPRGALDTVLCCLLAASFPCSLLFLLVQSLCLYRATRLLSFGKFSYKFLKLLPLRLPQCTRQPRRADFVLKAGVSVSISAWQIHIFFVERQLPAKVKLIRTVCGNALL